MADEPARTRIVKALAKGLVTIPSEFREALGIKAHTLLSMSLMGDHLEITRYGEQGHRQDDRDSSQAEAQLRRFSDEEIRRFLEEDKLDAATAMRIRELPEQENPQTAVNTLVFLHASVLVAASCSESGSSAIALEVFRARKMRAAVTGRVLQEALANIAERFGEPEIARFYQQVARLEPEIVPVAPPDRTAELAPLAGHEDAPMLASALQCKAVYLFTLRGRPSFTDVLDAGFTLAVVCPGDFLRATVEEPPSFWRATE